jgi:hypothetical protein
VFYDNGGSSAQYLANSDETMTFTADASPYIVFDFTHFNISNDDTLFVYDGVNTSAPMIGKYTGTQLPEKIYNKTGTSVTFRFISGTTNNADGWRALISCETTPPSQIFNIQQGVRYTCGGTFYDNGGSTNSYSSSLSRTMTFYSDNGNRIRFNFNSFSTETGFDYLRIYDGPNTSYPLLGTYSGSSSPGSIQSTGTSLTFFFNSDGSNVYSGWSADISCTTPPLDYYPITPGTVTTCNGVFFDSGSGDDNYSHNEDITQTFCSGNGQFIIFDFSHFSVNTDDTLYAYDGPNTSSQLIGKYTGLQLPEKIYSKSGTCVTFRFVSNTVNSNSGWRAFISCSAAAPQQDYLIQPGVRYTCGGNFYDDGGLAYAYSNSISKTMTFISPDNSRLNFNFSAFSTETGFDKLYIYDGPSTAYPLIGTWSGSSSPGSITSTGNALTFYFYSDASNTYSGWAASITCTTPALTTYPMTTGTINTCSGVFYDAGGAAANYPHNENRVQTFCSDAGTFIRFNFQANNFNISSEDSLYVYDGNSESAPILAIFTGNSLPEEISSQTGSCLTFKFYSNNITNAIGWQSLISCSTTPSPMNMYNMSNGVRYTCNASFYDTGGPTSTYANSENRTMTFRSNSGCPMSVSFTAFSTESSFDHLYVYDGNSTTATLLGDFTGSAIPSSLTSSGNALTFRFYSDGSNVYSGFAANLSCTMAGITANPGLNACPGETVTLTATAGDSYLWSNGATTQNVYVTSPGIYSVTVTDGSCNLVSNPVYVSFFSASSVSITPGSATTFCQGNSVNLSSTSGNAYLWSNGQTSQTINVTTSGNYYVTVTSVNGCTAVAGPQTVTMNTTPSAPGTISGNNQVCSGLNNLNYSVSPVSGATSYTWTVPSGATIISGQGSESIIVDWGTVSGYVQVYTSNATCNSSQSEIYVTMGSVPAMPTSISGTATPCEGSTQTYSVSLVSGVSYAWTLPSGWVQTSGGNTNIIQVTTGAASGDITVTPSNICGNGSPQNITLSPTQLPTATSSISGNNSPCHLSTQTYSVDDIPGYSFNWNVPSGWTIVSGSNAHEITILPEQGGGMLSVNAVNSCGSGPLAYFGINPLPLPIVSIGPDTTLCEDESYIVSATAGFSNYVWSTNQTGVSSITADTSLLGIGNYVISVEVTDNNGCTATDYTTITFEVCSYVANQGSTFNIKLYPNPAKNELHLVAEKIYSDAIITILNPDGRIIQTQKENYFKESYFDISHLSPGIYFLRITTQDSEHTFRWIKE